MIFTAADYKFGSMGHAMHYLSEVPGPTSVTGGDGEEATPVPISNTEVKLFSVDGTAWETMWESRTPPVLFLKALIKYNLVRAFSFSIGVVGLFL